MNTSLAHRYAVMTLTVRMAVLHRHLNMLSRRWLSVSELSCHSPTCQLSTVRRQNTEPWYRTDLQPKNQKTKMNFSANENRFSILRNPGVVSVERLTKEEICELLVQSVVYRKGPLVAINKPQGLSIAGKPELVSLLMLLPELKQQLGVREDLHVVKAATKESSGLVLLSTCHNTTKRIEDFYAECRKISKPVATYWSRYFFELPALLRFQFWGSSYSIWRTTVSAEHLTKAEIPVSSSKKMLVTVGVPNPPEGEIKAFLKIERIGELDLVVPVMHPSKGSLERREVKRTETRYKVLDQATDCALVQLQPFSSFQAQLLVHPTLKFCPLLGDHTYSARVGKILGEDIYVPVDVALPRTQIVDEPILRRIHFTQQQMHRMPLHLHLHQLLLPLYPRGGELEILTAPPPPFFQRTLYLLGLNWREKPDCPKDVQHFAGEK